MFDFEASRQDALAHIACNYTVHDLTPTLSMAQREEYAPVVWEVAVPLDRGEDVPDLKLLVALPSDFPFVVPRVFVADPNLVHTLRYPLHLNRHGFVCTVDPVTTQTNVLAPGEIVDAVLRIARDIIADGYRTIEEERDYSDEYHAYWNQKYGNEAAVDRNCLSLLTADDGPETQVFRGTLSRIYGTYDSIVYSEHQAKHSIFDVLSEMGITVSKSPAFHVGRLDLTSPPFRITHRDAIDIVECALGATASRFRRYINRTSIPTVIFTTSAAGHDVHLGWMHHSVASQLKSLQRVDRYKMLRSQLGNLPVTRLSLEDVTIRRFLERSSGIDVNNNMKPSVTSIVGLGSIGSNVAPYLAAMPEQVLHFVDPDSVKAENIGRHLLGLEDTGRNKAEAVASFLKRTGSVAEIKKIYGRSIISLLCTEPNLLSTFDDLFICVGDLNIEQYLDDLRTEGQGPRCAAIHLWVEPLLVGGHCLYLPSSSSFKLSEAFDNGHYRYNIISPSGYEDQQFSIREQGCQTTFLPYSGGNAKLFVGGIMTHVVRLMRERPQRPVALTWVGDTRGSSTRKIALSSCVAQASMGDILRVNL